MSEKDNVIPIYAAISPRGEIIKSSIGTFRIHAHRFAMQYKNFKVIKLAELNTQVQGRKPIEEPADVKTQKIEATIEVPQANLDKPRRKTVRRQKQAAVQG
jgi:hypothetical protein